jgi:hypothetical protein
MINAQVVENVLKDWKNGLTHGQICRRHSLNRKQEFAITLHSKNLSNEQIANCANKVKPNMRARKIIAIMENG